MTKSRILILSFVLVLLCPWAFAGDIDATLTTTDASTTFDVKESGGVAVATIDSAGKITTGNNATSDTGAIVFKNATNTNTLTLASGTTSATHTLTLPTANASGALTNDGSGGLTWSATGAAGSIPSGTAPVVDAAGEIAVDTTDDQLIYFGTAKRVLTWKFQKSATIEGPASTDEILLWKTKDAITITSIDCLVDPADSGESAVIDLEECDSTADNCTSVDAAITCDNDGATDDGSLSNASIAADGWLNIDGGAVTGTVTMVSVTIHYTIDGE